MSRAELPAGSSAPAQGSSGAPARRSPLIRTLYSPRESGAGGGGSPRGRLRKIGLLLSAHLLLAGGGPAPTRAQDSVGSHGPSTLVHPPFKHTYGIHKARTQHLKLFLGGRTLFADPQGVAAVKLAQDDDPKLKLDDFQLTLFGLNSGRGEIIYNSSMQTLAIYGTYGRGQEQFDSPHGIAADVNGNVYVADTGNRRVVHLTWRDRQLRWSGTLPGTFGEPWGVTVAPPGEEVYISDRLANQVYRWRVVSPAGQGSADRSGDEGDSGQGRESELEEVFPEGIERPTALAIVDRDEQWLKTREDALFVVYDDGKRLAKFDRHGRLLAAASASDRDSLRAPPRFAYLAPDLYGNVYVTDTGNSTIYKFKGDLTFLTSYGEFGEGDYQLNEPRGIAIWKRFGQVFVAEKEGAQYFFVGTDVRLPEGRLRIHAGADSAPPRYAFEAFFTEPSELSLVFLSDDGTVVDSLTLTQPLDSGAVTVEWEGTDVRPDLAQRATRVVLEPRPTYSSRRRFLRRIEREIEWLISR